MLSIIDGYKTYATLVIILLHQIFKYFGMDILEADISNVVDSLLVVLAIVMRYVARPKVV